MQTPISGFSKLSKKEKIAWIVKTHFHNTTDATAIVEQYWHKEEAVTTAPRRFYRKHH